MPIYTDAEERFYDGHPHHHPHFGPHRPHDCLPVHAQLGVGPLGAQAFNAISDAVDNWLDEHPLSTRCFYRKLEGVYVTESDDAISIIDVPIDSYSSAADALFVDVNGLVLVEGVDYAINSDSITLVSPIEHAGTVIHFIALRAVEIEDYDALRGPQGIQGPQGPQGPQGVSQFASFANPIEWNRNHSYISNTIVLHDGNSFLSLRTVPSDVDITNTDYWAEIGNYNAQIEAYRNEVLELSPHVQRNIISLKAYDIPTDGTTDVTGFVQNIIDAAPMDSIIQFPTAQYLFNSTLVPKDGVSLDFNNSEVVFTDTYFIRYDQDPKMTTVSTQQYESNKTEIIVDDTENINVGDLIVILGPSITGNYHYGFVSLVTGIYNNTVYLMDSVPYSMNAGISIKVYTPVTFNIENISLVRTTRDTDTEDCIGIYLYHVYNCVINNVHFRQNFHYCVYFDYTYGCVADSCSIYTDPKPSNSSSFPNPYFIGIGNSSASITRKCYGSSNWHLWTTGGNVTCINNIVRYCNHYTMHAGSYVDHENTIGTKIQNCVGSGRLRLAAQSVAENCILHSTSVFGIQCPAHIGFGSLQFDRSAMTAKIQNITCDAISNELGDIVSGEWASVIIDSVNVDVPTYFGISTGSGISCDELVISNCCNIIPTGQTIQNCIWSDSSISGDVTSLFTPFEYDSYNLVEIRLPARTTMKSIRMHNTTEQTGICFRAMYGNKLIRMIDVYTPRKFRIYVVTLSSTTTFLVSCSGYDWTGMVRFDENLTALGSFTAPQMLRISNSLCYVIGNYGTNFKYDESSSIITS